MDELKVPDQDQEVEKGKDGLTTLKKIVKMCSLTWWKL